MIIESNLSRWFNSRTSIPSSDENVDNTVTINSEKSAIDEGNFNEYGPNSGFTPEKSFSISDLDIDSIDNGRIKISVPLNKGMYLFPGIFANAKVKVKQDCHAFLTLVVSRNENHESIIKGTSIEFNPPLKVKNPASAFKKSNKFTGKVKDLFADVVLRGIAISQEAKIHLDGYLSLGILGRKDINSQIKTDAFPIIDLRLKRLFDIATSKNSRQGRKIGTWTLFDVLKQVGAVTERAQYSIDLKTNPMSFEVESNNFSSWTQKSRTDIHFAGTAKITSSGEVEIASNPLESFVKTDDISIQFRSETVIGGLCTDKLSLMTHVGAKTKFKNLNAKIEMPTLSIPLTIGGENSEIDTRVFVFHGSDGETKLKEASSLSFKVDSRMPENFRVKVAPGEVKLSSNNLKVSGGANFESVGKNLQINSGSMQIDGEVNDVEAQAFGYTASFKGNVAARVAANKINKPASMDFPTFSGAANLEINPSRELDVQGLNIGSLHRDFNYDFRSLDKVKIESLNSGLTEFIDPLSSLVLSPQSISDPKLPAAGDIGSEAWRNRIQEITTSPIRAGNTAELLIDGVMSFPKRLEL
ncbi:MAG: hypothetical protein O2897_02695, partial [bacterium]|nr:hypothetical protein [bacterium]